MSALGISTANVSSPSWLRSRGCLGSRCQLFHLASASSQLRMPPFDVAHWTYWVSVRNLAFCVVSTLVRQHNCWMRLRLIIARGLLGLLFVSTWLKTTTSCLYKACCVRLFVRSSFFAASVFASLDKARDARKHHSQHQRG
jgi:hypothetical protein